MSFVKGAMSLKNLKHCLLVVLVSLLAVSGFVAHGVETETHYSEKTGRRITLIYPDYADHSVIQSFMKRREDELANAEDLLDLKISSPVEIRIDPVLISGGAGFSNLDKFHYTVPYCILSGIYETSQFFYQNCSGARETGVHEMTHLLAKRKLNPLVPPFLAEGMSEAMDFAHRSKDVVDPHLASKGLLLLAEFRLLNGLLKLTRTGLTWPDQKKHLYWQGGSFVAFLIDEYGLEKFKEFYKTDYITLTLHPDEVAGEIYGKNILQLEKDWKNFLEGYAPGEEKRARIFLRAWEDRLGTKIYEQLVKVWEEYPFELIGYSSRAYRLTREIHCARTDLGNLSGPPAEVAQKEYLEANQEAKELLETWLRAAELYERAKKEMDDPSVPLERYLSRLREVRSLYSTAGDNYMARKVSVALKNVSAPHVI
jgi:hypothetical protein